LKTSDLRIPGHIAIIMDGNGRWAKKHSLPRIYGHRTGIESVRAVIRTCARLGVNSLTLFTFSRENWSRPKSEVKALMSMLKTLVRKEVDELNRQNVSLRAIGRLDDLPRDVRKALDFAVQSTSRNTGLSVYLALSYGSRTEILDAMKRAMESARDGELDPESLDEESLRRFLYAPELEDPDLLIRTSGEMRVSNFLLWQIAYSEIYVTKTLWPDFRGEELIRAIREYSSRDRRFGGVSEE
jgi:undecaprenyl diphosphate synthase